jgi:ribose transport system permease protein
MIFTLGTNAIAQGLMIVHTSGFAPQERSTAMMHFIAVGRSAFAIPNALWIWVLVGLFVVVLLKKTILCRRIYAIGNRELAVYLSGVNTRRVIIASFAICGSCSAISGVLLAGYSTHAYQAMGDPYLLPAIAAVVLGGTHILGGRGTFLGTIAGVIFITLLQSILSVVQVPESGRQIIYGVVIVSMLLLYGRERLQQCRQGVAVGLATGVAVVPGVAVAAGRATTPVDESGFTGVSIVPFRSLIGRLLRNLLSVQQLSPPPLNCDIPAALSSCTT